VIVIRGGDVLTAKGWQRVDIAIEDGAVSALATVTGFGADEIDAAGCLVGPGFVDMHTHLREPGQTWKEDIASGSSAAVAGGFTAITAMPNTDPPMDTPKVVGEVTASAAEVGLVEVVPSAALTVGRAGTTPTSVADLYAAGVRLFTDDGDSVADTGLMRALMSEIASHRGAFVAQHAEDTMMTRGRHMHEGEMSRKLGIPGMPVEAEARVVERDLELVAETGASYHCQHVSAETTVDLIRSAKESGMRVTAEVTPHHLTFDETALDSLDPDLKMYPPLRSPEDRHALVDALRSGTIDVVATDHAPHLPEEKAVGFADAPRGVIGLETAASAMWATVGDRDLLFSALSTSPARILGLAGHGRPVAVGEPANIVVFDPAARWAPTTFRSRSSNSPYRGMEMRGQVRATIHGGRVVYVNGVGVE
jgi:dihydroorotase